MASRAGTTDDLIRADKFIPFPGRAAGLGVPFHQDFIPFVDKVPIDDDVSGPITASGGSSASKSISSRAGTTDDDLTIAGIWFEIIHALPRAKIEFGNIITLVENSFEVYNAHRTASVTLLSILNNVDPGVILPTVSAPVVMLPMTSILDPTTTDNSGGTGLGTIVLAKVQALADGVPQFDDSIVFDTSANDPLLLLSGSRIVLFPFGSGANGGGYEVGARESLAFLTNVITGLDGQEQRISLRKQPRQSYQVEYALDGPERQAMRAMLFEWMDNTFGFPVWKAEVFLTAAVSGGATTYPVSGAADVDFRVGGLAAAITDFNTFDVIDIIAPLNDTTITAQSPSINAYPIGTPIVPLRIGIIPNRVNLTQLLTQENFRLTFEVIDNDTGALAGDTTPGFWSTHNGRVLFDDCNVVEGGSMPGKLERRLYRIDGQVGKVEISSLWDRNKWSGDKGFLARSRSEILELRKLFIALGGRWKSFYIPTFIEEVTVVANLVIGTATMDITNIGYVRFIQDRLPMSLFRISFDDGTNLVRTVDSSAVVSSTVERLTVDVNWPANRTVAEIDRIEWYELVRFDSDTMVLTYPRIGMAKTTMPVRRVFDDNA